MNELIWISDWEIQCCGSEFAIGDETVWPVSPMDRSDPYWMPILGPELTEALTGSCASHEEEPPPRMSGTVRRIRTVSCRYAPLAPPADQGRSFPVPGTAVIEQIQAIEKWYGTDFDPEVLNFRGWLVDLEVLHD